MDLLPCNARIGAIFATAAVLMFAGSPAHATEPVLQPLTSEALQDTDLRGELGCSFTTGSDDVLMVAFGNVATDDPADALVQTGDHPERLSAPGGFDAMLDGGTFAGAALELDVELVGDAVGGGESPPYPARLSVRAANGTPQAYEGFWTCGP